MKTLFIHQAFITPNEFGGTRHYELAQLAATKGHTFTIIASDLNYMTGKKVAIDKQSDSNETDEIQIVRSYTAPVHHRSFVWRIVSFFSFTNIASSPCFFKPKFNFACSSTNWSDSK